MLINKEKLGNLPSLFRVMKYPIV